MSAGIIGATVPASAAQPGACSINALVAEDVTFSFSDAEFANAKAQLSAFGGSFVGFAAPTTLGVTSFGGEAPLPTAPRLTGVNAVTQAGVDKFAAQVAGYTFDWGDNTSVHPGSRATNWQSGLREAFDAANTQGAKTIAFVTDGVPNSYIDANGTFVSNATASYDPNATVEAKLVIDEITAAGIKIVPIFVRTSQWHGLNDPVSPTPVAQVEQAMQAFQPGWTVDKAIEIPQLSTDLKTAALTACTPEINVSKNAEGDDSTEVPTGVQQITTTIVNSGQDALKDLVFTDTTLSGNAAKWDQGDLDKLATLVLQPGESFTVHGTVDVKYGVTHKDTTSVTGTGVITGTPVKDEDPSTLVPKPETPGVDLSKNKEGDDLNKVEKGSQDVVATVKNSGTEPLGNLAFTDATDAGPDVKWAQADLDKLKTLVLKPGESFAVHGTLTLKAGERHRDMATVTGKGTISGTPVKDTDPTRYETPQEPKVDVSKNAEGDDQRVIDAGEQHITATIRNTGTEALKDFTFSDKTSSGAVAAWDQGDLDKLKTLVLKPGESFVVHGTVTVKAGEPHKDTATVTATGVISGKPVTDEDPTTLIPPAVPGVPEAHTGGAIAETNPLVPAGLGVGAILMAGVALTLVIRQRLRSATKSE